MAEISTTTVTVVDNLDGTVLTGLPDDEVARITFSVGRRRFRLDLTAENAAEFHRDLDRWISVATPIRPGRGRPADGLDRETRRIVRAWAAANGHEVHAYGMVPRDIVAAWREATGPAGAGAAAGDELGQVAS